MAFQLIGWMVDRQGVCRSKGFRMSADATIRQRALLRRRAHPAPVDHVRMPVASAIALIACLVVEAASFAGWLR